MAIKFIKHLLDICRPFIINDDNNNDNNNIDVDHNNINHKDELINNKMMMTTTTATTNDQLFRYCSKHSNQMGNELIKNRFDYYQLGFQHCFNDFKQQFLLLSSSSINNSNQSSESLFNSKMMINHIQQKFDNLSIGKLVYE